MPGPEMELVEEMLEAPQRKAVLDSALAMLNNMCALSDLEGGWNLREVVWPALAVCENRNEVKARMVLLPLERIGGEPGRSGNRVMIAYFEQIKCPSILRSQPLVLKVSSANQAQADKLQKEWQQAKAIRPHLAYHKDAFAVPVSFHAGPPAVLWSPFASNREIWGVASHDSPLQIRELWQDLDPAAKVGLENKDRLFSILDGVYALLWPLHRAGGTINRKNIKVLQEYYSYLRHINDPWAAPWRARWGDDSTETASDFGRTGWINPFHLIKKLEEFRADLWVGAVQGDLHPRNILLGPWNSPNVIDFGWASEEAHIAKDFALLECNLRFMTLPPAVSLDSAEKMAKWLVADDPTPDVPEEAARLRIELITRLWENVLRHFPEPIDWTTNYLLPLFLVAMGLLRHNVDCGHQEAARLTVLHLAKRLSGCLTMPRT
jgi:hypothetical protein